MWVSLTAKSGNVKVGPIPVSTTEEKSCPSECPLKGTDCYARFGPLGIHWRKVGNGRGDNWTAFCKRVKQFASGQLWRHNQAGDLPQNRRGLIHKSKLRQLVNAAAHTMGWTYTHYDPTIPHNFEAIKAANQTGGLLINLSADNVHQADEYAKLNIGPVVTILPLDAPHTGNKTPEGRTITVCPAQTQESMTCAKCQLCAKPRKTIVGFLAHGTASKRLSKTLSLEG